VQDATTVFMINHEIGRCHFTCQCSCGYLCSDWLWQFIWNNCIYSVICGYWCLYNRINDNI